VKIGAPNSAARWLSENIDSIPREHVFALMAVVRGQQTLVASGSKKTCDDAMKDCHLAAAVVCELDKYRAKPE